MLSLAVAALAFQAPLAPYRSSYAAAVSPVDAQRTCAPQMASNIRALRDRVKSVKNTKKITSAMKLVAAAKVRRAQEAVLRSRPFSEMLERILGGLLKRLCTWTWRGGASAGGFAPVPALEHVEGDLTVDPVELTEAHGTVDLEHPLFLQLPSADKQFALAQ